MLKIIGEMTFFSSEWCGLVGLFPLGLGPLVRGKSLWGVFFFFFFFAFFWQLKRNQCDWRASSNFELELIKLVIVKTYKRLVNT